LHVDAIACNHNAFRTQAQPLLKARFAGEANASTCAEYTVPWDTFASAQCPDYLACGAGVAAGFGDFPIGGYFSLWNAPYGGKDVVEHAGGHESIVIN
jgi:hypothetical protein